MYSGWGLGVLTRPPLAPFTLETVISKVWELLSWSGMTESKTYPKCGKEKLSRTCRVCGLEAKTNEGLELFVKNSHGKHGRDTICKKCSNEKHRQYNRKYYKLYPLAQRYKYMMTRCYNPNYKGFHVYGGRGITVCDEWRKNRQLFYKWAEENGFKPELHLDRINNDDLYSPENCRWVTSQQQNRNTSYNTTNFEKGTRICSKCKTEKLLKEFHKNRSRTLGYDFICKKCINKRKMEVIMG